jgi:hypothetical protein
MIRDSSIEFFVGAFDFLQRFSQIAEAMEDVILRLTRRGRSGHNDLIDDALDVLRAVDPERAERLSGRRGAVRSEQNRNGWVSFLARLMWVEPRTPSRKEPVAVRIAAGGDEAQVATTLWRLATRPRY